MALPFPLSSEAKMYALCRMRLAIDRAIYAKTAKEKEHAARWAAAWGSLGGIPSNDCQKKPAPLMLVARR